MSKKNASSTPRPSTPVRKALRPGSTLLQDVQDGLGALRRVDRDRIDEGVRPDFEDSLDVDASLRSGREGEHRWDYLLGHAPSGSVIGIEPHSATSGEVSTVIQKRRQALMQLRDHLVPGVTIARWLWVATGSVAFQPLDRAMLQLSQNGITFVGKRVLARHLPAAVQNASTSRVKTRK